MSMSLAGRVTDSRGLGLNGLTTQATLQGQRVPSQTTTTKNDASSNPGYWSFTGLADGVYLIQVQGPKGITTLYGPSQVQFNQVTVGANKVLLDAVGNITYFGTLTNASDRSLKQVIGPIEGAMAALRTMTPVRYVYQDLGLDGRTQVGLIAQEVEAHFPELVSTSEFRDQPILTLDYPKLTAVLLASIKELDARVCVLERTLGQIGGDPP